MNVVVVLNRQEAVPVRAIPYVTAWIWDPLITASIFAGLEPRLPGSTTKLQLSTYFMEDEVARKMRTFDWLNCVEDLQEAASRRKAENTPSAALRRKALELLPAEAFVWQQDLVECWEQTYAVADPQSENSLSGDSPAGIDTDCLPTGYEPDPIWVDTGDASWVDTYELKFAPHIPKDLRELVNEGFEAERRSEAALTRAKDRKETRAAETKKSHHHVQTLIKAAQIEHPGKSKFWIARYVHRRYAPEKKKDEQYSVEAIRKIGREIEQ